MTPQQKTSGSSGYGHASVPLLFILFFLGASAWGLKYPERFETMSEDVSDRLSEHISPYFPPVSSEVAVSPQPQANGHTPGVGPDAPNPTDVESPSGSPSTLSPSSSPTPSPSATPQSLPQGTQAAPTQEGLSSAPTQPSINTPVATPVPSPATLPPPSPSQTPWEQKAFRGIYISRYQITNNASEKMIRDRVRHYRDQGINTIIHGVAGNGCTMYKSEVMKQTFGDDSCPNLFQDPWLDWLIDEAHKQGMQVHAYFEKGIKLDERSPIFDTAVAKRWIVPGVDKTYPNVDNYLLDVESPEVATFFKQMLVEFVQKYPEIDAVQWDDYLGYHDELPGKVDRTQGLTTFVQELKAEMNAANPNVKFDVCHHNPYWSKNFFAADWPNWGADRAFIQVYNDANFEDELKYVEQYDGIAITDAQFHRLESLVNNPKIRGILIFADSGKPEDAVTRIQEFIPIATSQN
ncbi:MAG: family 10 glycosylhydrolase [Cyanobacteria bacterium P01_F01_bin.150]